MSVSAKRSPAFHRAVLTFTAAATVMGLYLTIRYFHPRPERREPSQDRRGTWAIPLEAEGVPNFFKVTDALYRGGQPTPVGMKVLERMGIRTVINLRLLHSDTDELEGTRLHPVRIKVEAWDADEEEVVAFLKVATDPERGETSRWRSPSRRRR